MSRCTPIFWLAWILTAIVALLFASSLASAQPITQPRGEIILSGFLSCSGPNGNRQCPFRHHYVEMVAGRTYALRIETTEFNAALMIEDERGNMLARDTDDFDTLPGYIVYRPAATGTYRLIASAKAPLLEGFYAIFMQELTVLFRVKDEMTSSDPLRCEFHARTYDVPMVAGQRYIIDLTSNAFSPYLKLLDMDGMIIAFQDESMGPRGTRIVYTPTRTASYRIVATTFDPRRVGAFMLSVSRLVIQSLDSANRPLRIALSRSRHLRKIPCPPRLSIWSTHSR